MFMVTNPFSQNLYFLFPSVDKITPIKTSLVPTISVLEYVKRIPRPPMIILSISRISFHDTWGSFPCLSVSYRTVDFVSYVKMAAISKTTIMVSTFIGKSRVLVISHGNTHHDL